MSTEADFLRKVKRAAERRVEVPDWHWLTAPLTSASWDGDAFSTTAKTKIDLSAVFGVPANVKAVHVRTIVRDAASSGAVTGDGYYLVLSPNDTAGSGDFVASPNGCGDDLVHYDQGTVVCNVDGDIWYQVAASGAGTFDVWLQIWGYVL